MIIIHVDILQSQRLVSGFLQDNQNVPIFFLLILQQHTVACFTANVY